MSNIDGLKNDVLPDLAEYSDAEKKRYKDIPLYYWNKIEDCVKIEHYSWHEESPFRYLDKQFLNEHLMRSVEIAVENEFLSWDNEASKRFMIKCFGMMRYDENIPPHTAWTDDAAFKKAAIETLKTLIRENESSEIIDIVRKAEQHLVNAGQKGDVLLAQIYERILYELNECSLKEFNALKRNVFERKIEDENNAKR